MQNNELPGGLLIDEKLRRDYRIKPVTGYLERSIVESSKNANTLAKQVSCVLLNAVDQIAGMNITRELVDSLSSGDRQFLILKIHSLINPGAKWHTCQCSACHEKIQFLLDYDKLPVKPASEHYPEMEIELDKHRYLLKTPCGEDEVELSAQDIAVDIRQQILQRLIVPVDSDVKPVKKFTDDDVIKVDQLIDTMSPQVSSSVSIECPYCGNNQEISIDHYQWIADRNNLDEEVHTIAFNYHWSEHEILSLGRARRKSYLSLINKWRSSSKSVSRSNGMHKRQGAGDM